ncbi:hypothetical protein [Amycolatopsis pithecellobii]|uniref:Uncharacterized protein n=1 Tax=Amycolatopsis pithecellobii TaxID=664692 RepID=A0A6N7Z8F0_9PSEU|nr:hypothetical protein [Amycolatopsis pithecellobii]MTD57780.1 hypothetical protein [Amycolatopsis pithecellobii]
MSYRRPRSGIIATIDGREYEANSYPREGALTLVSRETENPDPTLFVEQDGQWLGTVPVARCERLAEVTTVADHLGHTCQVISIAEDGTTGLYYLGDDMAAMPRDGFVQTDAGTWAKTVHIGELMRYRELHRDLLFDAWVRGGATS